jgi:moderate conductance mechanosensitive channel
VLLSATDLRPLTTWLEDRTDSVLLLWASDSLLEPLLQIGGVLLLAGIVSRLAQRAIRRVVERARAPMAVPIVSALRVLGEHAAHEASLRRSQRAEALGTLAGSAVKATIWTMAGLTALGTLGINLGPLIAGAGILGVAIGFGAQDLVRDLLRGISMLLEDQYGVGDVVDVGAASGVVEEVTLRTTRLRDVNGVVWHVPNGIISHVGNMTQEWSRMLLDVDVAYETDVDHAIAVLHAVLERFAADPEIAERLLAAPEIWGVHELADSSVKIRVVAKAMPGQQWELARRLRLMVKRELDAAGIEIPFPQRTVWHRGLGDPEPARSPSPPPPD